MNIPKMPKGNRLPKVPKAEKAAKPRLTWKERLHSRSLRVGGYSVAATLLVAAIAVAANVLVNALPSKYTQLDATSTQLFTISEQTETLVSGLENEVTIYWVVQDGEEDNTVETLLDRYNSLSDQVTVTKVDPDVSPTLVQQYVSMDELYNNSLIVISDERSTFVSYADIYEYDYSDYYTTGSYTTSFAGEGCLTSAIDYVTSEDLPKLYTLTGHGESELDSTFETAVEKENIEMEELSLVSSNEVPEDADCILINSPQSDLSEEEAELLLSYLQSGGSLLLLTDPLQDDTELTNLAALMAEYGVSAAEGIVVEGDQNSYAYGYPYYLLPTLSTHDITSPLKEGNYYVLLPLAQGIQVSDELRDGLTVNQFLTTSSSSFSKIAGYSLTTYEKEDGDIDGPFALGVAITDEIDDDTTAHIVWVSSSTLVDSSVSSMVSGGNQDLFLNALNWMCEKEESITIHAKSLSSETLTVPSGTASMLSVCMIGVIPAALLAAGIIIWVRRRRR